MDDDGRVTTPTETQALVDSQPRPQTAILHHYTDDDDIPAAGVSSKETESADRIGSLAGLSLSTTTPASVQTNSPASEYFDCVPLPSHPLFHIMPYTALHNDPSMHQIVFNSPSKEIVGTPFSEPTQDGAATRFEYPFPMTDMASPAFTTSSTASSTSSLHSPPSSSGFAAAPSTFQAARVPSSHSTPGASEMSQMRLHGSPAPSLMGSTGVQLKPVGRGRVPPMPPSLAEKLRKRASVAHVQGLGLQLSSMTVGEDQIMRDDDPQTSNFSSQPVMV